MIQPPIKATSQSLFGAEPVFKSNQEARAKNKKQSITERSSGNRTGIWLGTQEQVKSEGISIPLKRRAALSCLEGAGRREMEGALMYIKQKEGVVKTGCREAGSIIDAARTERNLAGSGITKKKNECPTDKHYCSEDQMRFSGQITVDERKSAFGLEP
jgi:hypothetical protein